MKINKFNIGWQIVRTKARAIKDVEKKVKYVLSYLNSNPNIHNYGRVMNWVRMTGVAYPKGSDKRQVFLDAEQSLKDRVDMYDNAVDSNNDFKNIATEDLELVLKDLSKRKYGFQFKSVPKDHTEFVERIKVELANRSTR